MLLQKSDAKMFNDYLPELKAALINKGRSNFWQEIVEGTPYNLFRLSAHSHGGRKC